MYWAETNNRSIIHLNIADFAVAVERVVDVRLKGRPVIIAAPGVSRAIVYDMSEEAYQAGVRKRMALRQALRMCRDARILPPHPDHYQRAMTAFLKHAFPYSPLIEAGEGDGHLFIDSTGTARLFGSPADVAWRIRKAVKADLSFDPIWAVASNKLVAKVATRVVKPTGEYIVEPGEEGDFLRPLSIYLLPGVEREDLLSFREFHISRVGELARWTLDQLEIAFGKRSKYLYRAVRGDDTSPVLPVRQKPPVVSREYQFAEDTNDVAAVEAALYQLVERAGFEMRERGLAARRMGILLHYSDGLRVIRQRWDPTGTASDFKLFALAKGALELAWRRRVRIRFLRLTCDRLIFPPSQLELFPVAEQEARRGESLLSALDQIRNKFGRDAIRMGRTLAVSF